MKLTDFIYSAIIGVVASCRCMTPMATIAAARVAGRETEMGQTKSGVIEDALIVATGVAVVFFATGPNLTKPI
jgi:hypothetical protein